MTKTFIIKQIAEISAEEIDFKLYNDLFGEKQVDELYERGHPADYIIDESTTNQISIEYVEAILAKLKAQKANYVNIDYNNDDFSSDSSYTFTGYLIKKATKKEIKEHNDKIELKLEKIAKQKELREQFNKAMAELDYE
jgi:predicted MPP superfamily phosphohydrolase